MYVDEVERELVDDEVKVRLEVARVLDVDKVEGSCWSPRRDLGTKGSQAGGKSDLVT